MITAYKNFRKYRFLLNELVKKEIKLKYRRSYLGILWTLLEPMLNTMILTLVFSGLLGRGDEKYPVFILTGRLLYAFFANATKKATKSIRSHSAMIKKVYVPKYIYPFSSILSNFIIFAISTIVLFASMIIFKVSPTIHLIEAIIPLMFLLILAIGCGLILSTMAVFFRDLEYLWSVALMIVMYTSGIFFNVADLNIGNKVWLFKLNPLYLIINNFRNTVLYGKALNMEELLLSAAFSFGSLIIGVILFYKKQDKFILNI